MGRPGEVDRPASADQVAIPSRIVGELYAHAREAVPEECCGLVLGGRGGRFERVYRCKNIMTKLHQEDPGEYPRDGASAFYMSTSEVLEARREAEAAGLEVTAVYHSHVDGSSNLSELDRQYADHPLFPFPEADQIVVAVVRRDGPGGRGLEGAVSHATLHRRSNGGFRSLRVVAR